ncbi:hypothetical protein ACFSJU_11875 [Paradesertivirga mongoliensis]|uniref:YtxH domain-containing protein n=1 Tax=Paradesertivirga mongoliensis TaxID=2100740 RepID=A0ABW4ZLW8_9SPHI|nr:hypothetical protein [Pedobacter mongoliensis]
MLNLRLLLSGAALAAGIHYVTKKRPDGSSIADDIKAKAPDWMNQARPYIDQLKGQFSKVPHIKGNSAGQKPYPQKFDKFSPDPDPDYTS